MPDRETVIRGLEAHANPKSCETCAGEECPYYNMGGGFTGVTCSSILAVDALALLQEQEPRVMTREEVCNLKFDDVVYYQGSSTNAVESAIIVHGEIWVPEVKTRVVQFRNAGGTGGYNGINNADLDGYGKKWRAWTSRPSPEQMRDTKWEGDSDAE